VTDSKQFGNPKVLQFGDKTGSSRSGDGGHCAQCEAMLTDALDGTLSTADQAPFDTHMAACGQCSQSLADARRGAAFLEMLRMPAPEPPAMLLERILAETSGAAGHDVQHFGFPLPIPQHGDLGVAAFTAGQAIPATIYGNVVPFPRRFATAFRTSSIGQIMLQPRLAMTAAMAFFSIALTMNITGVHPQDLRASDLKPSSLKRDFYSTKASIVRRYDGLRVVYELESRVHDLEGTQDGDAVAPAPQSGTQSNINQAPSAQPGATRQPAQQKAAPPSGSQPGSNQPGSGQPARRQAAPDPGTSRREDLRPNRRLLVAKDGGAHFSNTVRARVERKLV
jgi:hypothetical protein